MSDKTDMPKNAEDVMKLIKDGKTVAVDLRYTDVPGRWQHRTFGLQEFEEATFKDGKGFDGSSITGFQPINASDMLLVPDPTSAYIDPMLQHPTLVMTCNVWDPRGDTEYSRDPRRVARRAEEHLRETGLADTAFFGPELEGFIFDRVRFSVGANHAIYEVDSHEGIWNSGQEGLNQGHRPPHKGGYEPVPPIDTMQDIRTEIMLELAKVGITVEVHHHEVATGGQFEIDFRYGTLTQTADRAQWYKYIVKMVAGKHGMTATFMPKPLSGDNGSGMHVHSSLWGKGEGDELVPLFHKEGTYGNLSDLGRWYVGGLLAHAPALRAIVAPTPNSDHRLIPGFEAPVNLVYGASNRSAVIRIPMLSTSPKAVRAEFRLPDPSCNPYLTLAAILMAGLDGVKKKIEPGNPMDEDVYHLSPAQKAQVKAVPGTLEEALQALERDQAFLLEGGVFTPDILAFHIEHARGKIAELRRLPHPAEFAQDYSC